MLTPRQIASDAAIQKLKQTSGTYTGAKETQLLGHAIVETGQTILLDYEYGQTQALSITTDDAFTLQFDNWPTSESGSMTLVVKVDSGVTVGSLTWPTLANTAPTFEGITADADTTGLGHGIYEIYFANGAYYIFVVEEA